MRRAPGGTDTGNDYERVSTETKRLAALQPVPSYIQPKAEVVKHVANNMKLISISP